MDSKSKKKLIRGDKHHSIGQKGTKRKKEKKKRKPRRKTGIKKMEAMDT